MPRTEVDGPQATNDLWHWRGNNGKAYDDHKQVIGLFFAGGDPVGDFQQNPYNWQKLTGERTSVKPKAFIEQANNQVAYLLWNKAQTDIDNLPEDQRAPIKEQVRQALIKKYPGFSGEPKDRGKFDKQMAGVRDALKNPAINTLQSAHYIEQWMNVRDEAIQILQDDYGMAGGLGALRTKTAQRIGLSDQLLTIARTLRQQDTSGGFTNAWTRLFSQEFDKGAIDNG